MMNNHSNRQRPWAIGLSIIAILTLAYPSATAVYEWLLPTRGQDAAYSAAAGIELTYLSLACLFFFTDRLKRIALRLQLWAVFTAVLLNAVNAYSRRSGVDISTGMKAAETFDPWLLALSIGESIPLAGLAFGVSMVLHELVVDPPVSQASLLRRYWSDMVAWLAQVIHRQPENDQASLNASLPSNLAGDLVPVILELPGLSESDHSLLDSSILPETAASMVDRYRNATGDERIQIAQRLQERFRIRVD